MTPEQAIQKLIEQQKNRDTEEAHVEADDVLCYLLKSLGYTEVVTEYEKVKKWYS